MNAVKIKSFNNFIDNVKRVKKNNPNIIYRGIVDYENNSNELIPKLFREEHLYIDESELINGILSELPNEFQGVESNLEILLKLQHYGIPTRLLDVSFNPYISLFFSCDSETRSSNKSTNPNIGIVYIINGNELETKTIFSDKVSIMSSLSRLKDTQKDELEDSLYSYLRIKVEVIIWYLSVIEKKRFSNFLKIENNEMEEKDYSSDEEMIDEYFHEIKRIEEFDFTNFMEKLFSNEPLSDLIKVIGSTELGMSIYDEYPDYTNESILKDIKDVEIILNEFLLFSRVEDFYFDGYDRFQDAMKRVNEIYNNMTSVKRLMHEVRNYKPGFRDELVLDDLCKDYLIIPHKSNERIKNQQGGFILKGFGSQRNFLNKDYILERWEIPFEIMGIESNSSEENLLESLSTMNIDNSYIYPELEHYNVKKHVKKTKIYSSSFKENSEKLKIFKSIQEDTEEDDISL
ncbi:MULTISPECIES: FRG domain-containing protein [Vagococcus]|uniref:FRG domain-containing protein n=1 Tax=Vagococcus fluvialis bH819 TaxID=1255619 RepID=A0A1X6WPY0_9ENTE|nr:MULTISPECIES: FRG domain-containing protein [Vagococcus]SLM86364.1 hypothetical protein FM121_09755 [Vagococcus fluvialis bH819]HCM89018.1 FRG domain-containing protein [Vagococcus sp.]